MASPVLQFKRGLLANLPGLREGEPGFTTDSYDLYVGISSQTSTNRFFGSHRYWTKETSSTGSGVNLVEGTSNGSGYITLKAPNSLVGVGTYVLPDTNTITDGFFLKVSSDGTLSWNTASGVNGTFTHPTLTGITTINGSLDNNANSDFSGITTFSNTTDNTLGDVNTGAVQIDGGLGVDKNVTVGGSLNVQGSSEFVGVVTFKGGVINLGDDTTDIIDLNGRVGSNLVPTTDNTYDVGISTLNWRNAHFSGIGTFETGLVVDNIEIGIVPGNATINTTSGDLVLNSAGGNIIIYPHVDIYGDLDVSGNISLGGSSITLRGTDVLIENKDIILGYTTSIAPNDTTANHAGVAIASNEGTPLANFDVSGINTLPNTYKQMMWFKSGTLGFGTDAFAFNYGVAIGTTTMANGVRLAVGSGVTVSDTSVSATTFYGSVVGNVSSADQVKTITASNNNSNYYVTFVDANNGSATNESVYTDDGIYYNPGSNKLTTQHAEFTGNTLVSGISTFTGAIDANGGADISGGINVTGVSTFSTNVVVGGDIRINGNNIQASDGNTNITLTSNTLTSFAGDIKVGGNDIQASNGTTAITLSSADVTVAGDLQVTGNDIKSSTGAVAITLSANGVTIADDMTVSGNLYVNGNTTQVNTAAITVEDRTIELGRVDGLVPPSSTTWDLGVLFNYNASGAKKSAVIWEHSATRFQFASVLDADTNGTDVNTPQITVSTFAPIEIGALWVTDCAGTSQVISCTGSTRNLENITIDAGQF